MSAALALAFVFAATPAFAAEGVGPVIDLVAPVADVLAPVKDIDASVQDLMRVKQGAKEITIELPADILFDFDKANIRPDAAIALAEAAEMIRTQAKGTVKINGHTDSKGSAAYNKRLSLARAESVKAWLVDKQELAKVPFAIKGLGASQPVARDANPDGSDNSEGRQLNRRVEIVFTKK